MSDVSRMPQHTRPRGVRSVPPRTILTRTKCERGARTVAFASRAPCLCQRRASARARGAARWTRVVVALVRRCRGRGTTRGLCGAVDDVVHHVAEQDVIEGPSFGQKARDGHGLQGLGRRGLAPRVRDEQDLRHRASEVQGDPEVARLFVSRGRRAFRRRGGAVSRGASRRSSTVLETKARLDFGFGVAFTPGGESVARRLVARLSFRNGSGRRPRHG